MIVAYLFTLIDDCGIVGKSEIECLLRGRGRGNERGEIGRDKTIPHGVVFSSRSKGLGNEGEGGYICRSSSVG